MVFKVIIFLCNSKVYKMVLLQFVANSSNDDVRIRNAFTARNLKIVEVCCVFTNATADTIAKVDIEPLDSLVNAKDNVISGHDSRILTQQKVLKVASGKKRIRMGKTYSHSFKEPTKFK